MSDVDKTGDGWMKKAHREMEETFSFLENETADVVLLVQYRATTGTSGSVTFTISTKVTNNDTAMVAVTATT